MRKDRLLFLFCRVTMEIRKREIRYIIIMVFNFENNEYYYSKIQEYSITFK